VTTSLLLWLLFTAAPRHAPDAGVHPTKPLLEDGDRVVFLGDSITVMHTYTRAIEAYVRLRHPTWTMTFINAGVGGNTAADALARLDTDVLAHQPTVVFVNFGMNDASYPADSPGAAFEKNMAELFDRLAAAKVRAIVWLDPTPFDAAAGPMNSFNRKRVERLDELVVHARTAGAARGLVVVPLNEAVTRALASWKAAGKETLMPDRIHPGAPLHAVMAAEILRAIGFDVASPIVKAAFEPGTLRVEGSSAELPWNGETKVTMDLSVAVPPLPMVLPAEDAEKLASKELLSLRRLLLKVSGLPAARRYRVQAGTLDAGKFTGAELAAGVDLLATAPPRASWGTERPTLAECTAETGNPWVNDYACVTDLLFEKDQLRIQMRHEKTKALPDFVPGMLEKYFALQAEWVTAVDRDIEVRVRTLKARPHEVTLEPEARAVK
jgi:lysophospholipase L1-like esterase